MKTITILWNEEAALLGYDCGELSRMSGECFEQAIGMTANTARLGICFHDYMEEIETHLTATVYDEEDTKLGRLYVNAKTWEFDSFDESVCYSMNKKN